MVYAPAWRRVPAPHSPPRNPACFPACRQQSSRRPVPPAQRPRRLRPTPGRPSQTLREVNFVVPPCCSYVGYLFFQLKTHADFFAGEESEETPALSLSGAVACLVTITLIVAVCSGAEPAHSLNQTAHACIHHAFNSAAAVQQECCAAGAAPCAQGRLRQRARQCTGGSKAAGRPPACPAPAPPATCRRASRPPCLPAAPAAQST